MNQQRILTRAATIALAVIALTGLTSPVGAQSAPDAETLVITARGRTGAESAAVVADGRQLAILELGTQWGTHEIELDAGDYQTITVEAVHTGWPESVIVDRVEVAGSVFEAEDAVSVGQWTDATGCDRGAKGGEWLHCADARFEFEVGPLTIGRAGPVDPDPPIDGRPVVIFDTDMGPDVDDAVALAALHGYANAGAATIAAVTLSRDSNVGARYIDAVNTAYGRPNIPIGTYRSGDVHADSDFAYTGPVVDAGNWPYQLPDSAIGIGYRTMRRVLADAQPGSVVIIQVGFSTNTAELLQSGPDDISPLTGLELVESKVRLLSVMGGRNGSQYDEFNIVEDLESAAYVFDNWPVDLIQSEGDLGHQIIFPYDRLPAGGSHGCEAPSIIADSWAAYDFGWHVDRPAGLYDLRSWDVTSVIAGIEGTDLFTDTQTGGTVVVDPITGLTDFEFGGRHTTLGKHWNMSAADKLAVTDRMVALVAAAG